MPIPTLSHPIQWHRRPSRLTHVAGWIVLGCVGGDVMRTGSPFTPSGPSFWRGLKCDCGTKAAFVVWDRAKCGDCYRALLATHNGKFPWKEPRT